jgi:hypothetical protein
MEKCETLANNKMLKELLSLLPQDDRDTDSQEALDLVSHILRYIPAFFLYNTKFGSFIV